MERKELEQKANQLLADYGMENEINVDVVVLARKMGFIVASTELNDGEDGFVIVDESKKEIMRQPTSKLIVVNEDLAPEDKIFVVAHEIGHYVLDGKSGTLFAARETAHGRSDSENDIDFFAACLIMPKVPFEFVYNKFRDAGDSKYKIIEKLSKSFRSTQVSVMRRIDELELDTEGVTG